MGKREDQKQKVLLHMATNLAVYCEDLVLVTEYQPCTTIARLSAVCFIIIERNEAQPYPRPRALNLSNYLRNRSNLCFDIFPKVDGRKTRSQNTCFGTTCPTYLELDVTLRCILLRETFTRLSFCHWITGKQLQTPG